MIKFTEEFGDLYMFRAKPHCESAYLYAHKKIDHTYVLIMYHTDKSEYSSCIFISTNLNIGIENPFLSIFGSSAKTSEEALECALRMIEDNLVKINKVIAITDSQILK